ncbi:MAG: MFS transporter [Candidatus Woesearchaeota archaeon]
MRNIIYLIRNYEKHHAELLILSLLNLFTSFSRGALVTYVPAFVNSFAGSIAVASLILAIPFFVNIFNDIAIGNLASRVNKKTLILSALALLAVVGIAYFVSDSIIPVIIGLIVYGFAADLYFIPAYSAVAAISPRKEDAEYDAIFNSFGSLGWTLGPLAGGFILSFFIKDYIFLFFSILCVFTFLFVLFAMKSKPKQANHEKSSFIEYAKNLSELKFLNRETKTSLFLAAMILFWDNLLWMMIPIFVVSNGMSPQYTGILLTFACLPYMLFRIPAGIFEDKLGKKQFFIPSLAIVAASFVLFGLSNNIIMSLLLVFVLSTGGAILSPAVGGLIIDNTIPSQRSVVISLRNIFVNFATIISFVLGGLIAQFFGFSVMFISIGFVVIAAGIITEFSLFQAESKKKELK